MTRRSAGRYPEFFVQGHKGVTEMVALQSGGIAGVLAAVCALSGALQVPDTSESAASRQVKTVDVIPNDNRNPAGTLVNDVLTLDLRAAVGTWRPEGKSGPALQVDAFGEATGALTAPAPLIRVPEGTEIVVSVRNELPALMRVHGFCERTGDACAPFDVPAGETRDVRFKTGRAGTYHYWATTMGMPLPFRAADDTQLSGAFIVDAVGTTPESDRVLVITDWTSITREQLQHVATQDDPGRTFLAMKPDVQFFVNGLAWPHTERLTYGVNESVRWRVVNLSSQVHPMHLHGFYFEIDSLGDGVRDARFDPGKRQRVVTQVMQPGSTMAMTWIPERVGNWLFHCHVMLHVSPTLAVDGSPRPQSGTSRRSPVVGGNDGPCCRHHCDWT